jgi:hypothetical protein
VVHLFTNLSDFVVEIIVGSESIEEWSFTVSISSLVAGHLVRMHVPVAFTAISSDCCNTIVCSSIVLVKLILGSEAGRFEARDAVPMGWIHILGLPGDLVTLNWNWLFRWQRWTLG